MKKARVFYALAALALFGVEACIALFVRDNFVRPYLGDVLVVILIHCAVRVVFPAKPRLLPVYVFLFACLVEFTQYIHLLDMLGLAHIGWLRIIIGGTFDWADIACYAAGCVVVGAVEHIWRRGATKPHHYAKLKYRSALPKLTSLARPARVSLSPGYRPCSTHSPARPQKMRRKYSCRG